MSDARTPEEVIAPYLNPAYWDGHMLGGYDPRHAQHDTSVPPSSRRSLRVSRSILGERLSSMARQVPIDTYNDADEFTPNDCPVGSVVALRIESLRGAPISDENRQQYECLELPARPLDTRVDYDNPQTALDDIITQDRTYISQIMLGIVAHNKEKGHSVHAVSASLVRQSGSSVIVCDRMLPRINRRVVVGRVRHFRYPEGIELLERYNVIDLLARDQSGKRARTRLFSARLALGMS